jgi:hypothetical protein
MNWVTVRELRRGFTPALKDGAPSPQSWWKSLTVPRSGIPWHAECGLRNCRTPCRRTWRPMPWLLAPACSGHCEPQAGTSSRAGSTPSPTTCPRSGWIRSRGRAGRVACARMTYTGGLYSSLGVTQDVHAAGGGDAGRLGQGQVGVERRAQSGVADARLDLEGEDVHHADRGAL